jgi:small subunit ribosomal protein S19e
VEVIFLKAFEVPPGKLVQVIAMEFEKQGVKMPAWALFVKTGAQAERAPDNKNWWNYRMASLLYRIYKDGPVGTQRLRTYYGGRKARGVAPHEFRRAGGKIIRVCLQELGQMGFVEKQKLGGRKITPKGEGFLDKMAKETMKFIEEEAKNAAEKKAQKEKERQQKEAEERKVKEELRKIGGARDEKAQKMKKKKKAEGEANEGK